MHAGLEAAIPSTREQGQLERDEAFVVVCRRGAVRVAAELTDAFGVWRNGKSQAIWAKAWTAAANAQGYMPEPIVAALLRGVPAQPLGADQWAEERRQRTPLWVACGCGHLHAARKLIEAGADVNRCASDGRSALWIAAEWGHVDVVQLLLSEGADCHKAQTATGMTPLYVASTNDHADVVLALLRAGADVDVARSDNGRTPLIAAADKGHDAVVTALLGERDDGATRFSVAEDEPDDGSTVRSRWHKRVRDAESMRRSWTADVCKRARDGNTALTTACSGHNSAYNLDIVVLLVAAVLKQEVRAQETRGSSRRISSFSPGPPATAKMRAKYEWSAQVDLKEARDAAVAKQHTQMVAVLDEALAKMAREVSEVPHTIAVKPIPTTAIDLEE